MLPKVSVSRRCRAMLANVQNYRMLISDELSEELSSLARELRDVRICHLNSTAFGGGVAEVAEGPAPTHDERREAQGNARDAGSGPRRRRRNPWDRSCRI